MRDLSELTAWDRLLKKILWTQLGDIKDKRILDFGSGARTLPGRRIFGQLRNPW